MEGMTHGDHLGGRKFGRGGEEVKRESCEKRARATREARGPGRGLGLGHEADWRGEHDGDGDDNASSMTRPGRLMETMETPPGPAAMVGLVCFWGG